MTYLKWKCDCDKYHISIDKRHHELTKCSTCGCYCDFETYSTRFGGNKIVELIKKGKFKTKKINYNFFDEIVLCMKEQGFELPVEYADLGWIGHYAYYDYSFVKDLEDECIEQLK